jgi:hypothetical protein
MVLDGIYSDQDTATLLVDVRNDFGFTYYLYTMQMNATPAPLSKSAVLFESKADINMTLVKVFPSEKMIQKYPETSQQQLRESFTEMNGRKCESRNSYYPLQKHEPP